MAIGGSIESISVNNRLFPVAADADVNMSLGGFTNEVLANGDGSSRQVKTRVPWMIDGVQLELDSIRADLEYLQEVSDNQEDIPIVITLVDGTAYQGRGTVEGDVQRASQSATGTMSFKGPGKLEQQ